MLGFDVGMFNGATLRRKKTQKETKNSMQFKKEINYSSSRNTIFLSN